MNSAAQIAKETIINLKLRMLTLSYSHYEIMELALKEKKSSGQLEHEKVKICSREESL